MFDVFEVFTDELSEGLAQQVCDGEKTLLQIERTLQKHGWADDRIDTAMRKVMDKVSERKKRHA